MTKSAQIRARIEPEIKENAEGVFGNLGISMSEAISIFLNQVIHHNGLPFPVRVPSDGLLEAMKQVEEGETVSMTHKEFQDQINSIWHEEGNTK